jgi:hypothetical protein
MPQYSITISPEVPGDMADELAKRVYFVSSEIRDFSLVYGTGGEVREVGIHTDGDVDASELARKLNIVVQRDVLPQQRISDADAVWQSMALPRASRIAFADVERAGLVTRMGDGTYATNGALADLLSRIDARVGRIGVEVCGAVGARYPALVPTDVLVTAGYIDAFPQFLMTASRFRSDVDGHDSFAADFAAADSAGTFFDRRTQHTGHCLSPTVCYHTYHQFSGRELPADGAAITASGEIFRFESRYHRTLERLWNFTMREVVFLGSREMVMETRQRLMDAICRWIDELRLAGEIQVANDPFFSNATGVTVQRALKLKYELHLPVVDGRTVAAGSFNMHGTKFGEAFGITLPGGVPAYSGCIGIGLERFAYAFLCRHGIDPSDWPEI